MPQVFTDPKEIKQDFAFLAVGARNKSEYERAAIQGVAVESEHLFIPVGCKLVRYNDCAKGFCLALINDAERVVLYYCYVVNVYDSELSIRGVSQALVWRNRMKPAYKKATQDFVAQVFNGYLIEHYNVIVSDVYHSYGGMFMWQEQLGLAIQRRDRNVFLYDQLNASKTPITVDTFDRFIDELWSEGDSKLHCRAIIAKA